ncbi:MAG: hypothetical protein FVQ80_01785 [Planctomycetes bacterium]|nr:hypothetical protein [Planctomycetota bacterium]
MTQKVKVFCFYLLVVMLSLSFIGCNASQLGGKNKNIEKVESTVAEKKKASLLKKLERKYEDAQAHFELGRLHQKDGLWMQAEQEYSIALSFDPVHREAQAARIKVMLDSGDKSRVDILSEEYINQAATSALGSLKLALAFQGHGLDEYALTCYQQALRLAPNSARVNRQIGYYYLSKGNKVQAQDYLSRSFQLDPMQPEVAGELGRLGVSIRIPTVSVDARKLDRAVDKSMKNK